MSCVNCLTLGIGFGCNYLIVNPKCPVQLMDLENDFFLDENNYNKALIGGPWVIFGRYLTVPPWPPDFSTSQSGIETQVVWIQFLGLPKGYYSDCLLRAIDQTVGLVVKLGVHKDCARRQGRSHYSKTNL
ncbi:reverse transcriptase [Gossypium australe]|uniref:Reverse transcriptase n=1 Tax=Gossypium australe TaxID=47621 RepID=A0A5B6U8B4_9ROSI|nr:reverse transcriptase [Gossypium australe]